MSEPESLPNPLENRPGLPQLSYRIGDYAEFRRRLLNELPNALNQLQGKAPLAALKTRSEDDPAIALLDAWAVVADVLTFYQERIINEGYLRTATERQSILELARSLGYELNPGVAASTYLAFTVEDTPDSPDQATVPKGTQIMSVPGENELPQTFETSTEILARADWNSLKPRPTRPQQITPETQQLYLQGITTQLQPGDAILLVDQGQTLRKYLLRVTEVEANAALGYTRIKTNQPMLRDPDNEDGANPVLRQLQVFAFRQRAALFGHTAPRWQDMPPETKRANGGTVKGGIFRWDGEQSWHSPGNAGLPLMDLICLVARGKTLFAGTALGVFRSNDSGATWEIANTGLLNFSLQTFHLDDQQNLFAGTAGGGAFRSKDGGDTWVPIGTGSVRVISNPSDRNQWQSENTAIPNTTVRAILSCERTARAGSGTLSTRDTEVRGTNTRFNTELPPDSQLIIGDQIRRITQVRGETELTLEAPFTSPNLIPETTFEFNSSDPESLPDRANDGTIFSAGTVVTGIGTSFFRLRDVENLTIWVPALNQEKTVIKINSDFELIIDSPFEENRLVPGTPYLFIIPSSRTYIVGTDDGVFYSSNQGKDWYPGELRNNTVYALCATSNFIIAGTQNGTYRSQDEGQVWNDPRIFNLSIFALITYQQNGTTFVAAGTNSGVYSSSDQGNSWSELDAGTLTERTVRALTVGDRNNTPTLFAATDAGIFCLNLTDATATWELFNDGILAPNGSLIVDLTALTTLDQTPYAASRFSGFVETEWKGFELEPTPIPLDAVYPKILKDSWVVLLEDDQFEAQPITEVDTVTQSRFTLTAKVTQLTPLQKIPQPDRFHRRTVNILTQSEPLQLATESLTVAVQQQGIFADPIQSDTIFLSKWVQGLQPQQTLIVSGQRMRAEILDVGGVFYSNDQAGSWQHCNTGLPTSNVYAFENANGTLLVGTDEGVFRSVDLGQFWEPVNDGLTNLQVRSLLFTSENRLFAGTADGIFFAQIEELRWQAANTGLTQRDVQAIALHQNTLFAATLNGGVFRSNDQGTTWTTTGLANQDVQTLLSDGSNLLAGTVRNGLYHSTDDGRSWEQITEIRTGTGSLTSDGVQVTGSNTLLEQELAVGDTLNAAGQTRTVVELLSSGQGFVVDTPFRPDLPPGTPFTINTGLTNRNITALAIASNTLFAGTAGSGIFRLKDFPRGKRWQQVNDTLTDFEIRCLLATESGVLAGTAKAGVFLSTNGGDLWAPANLNLTNTDVRTLLAMPSTGAVLAGGVGILLSPDGFNAVPLQKQDVLLLQSPPLQLPTSADYQQWELVDRNGFWGRLTTSAPQELRLLPASPEDEPISEVVQVKTPPADQQFPVLTLQAPLRYSYDPATVSIYGNVVQATHGETVEEVLGSGEGTLANQQFTLQKPPLTYIPAATVTGAASTLEVRVDEVLWQEVRSLYGQTARTQCYIIRLSDDGTPTLTFGDGISGARLPSGEENVVARYRSGIGLEGNLAARSLSLLKTRPLGIDEVVNPLPATGAAPPESREQARVKAPASVRTLDRIVSLRDFEDFTQAFAGIGKAQAVALWNGETQLVHVTIAGLKGAPVSVDSSLYQKLVEAIDAVRDPIQQVQVDSYEPLQFNLEARLLVDPRYEPEKVTAQVQTALTQAFIFEQQGFGQPVMASKAIAIIQSIPGVVAVDLDALYRQGFSKSLEQTLNAEPARWNVRDNLALPAQLLLLNPTGILLTPVLAL